MVKASNLSWIVVSDIEKAREFFTKVVGLKEMNFTKEYGWAEFIGEAKEGCILGVSQENADMPAGKNAVVTFTVDNLEKSRQEFQKKGVRLIGDIMEVPGHCKLQTFADEDGNIFQLVELLPEISKA